MNGILTHLGLVVLLGIAGAVSADMNDLVTIPVSIPEGSHPVVLEVHVGPMLAQAEVVVETLDGAFVGSVSTFGFKGIVPEGYPQISVARTAILTGDLQLTGKIILNGTERPATIDELRGIRVVLP